MQRDSQAFLLDVVDAGEAILEDVRGLSLVDYCARRLIRSAVEREFILIGEALANLSRVDPALFAKIDHGRQIISFRNKLSHDYAKVDHALVWGVIETYLPDLLETCRCLVKG
jgi:uncharacterized protein with HEPN domain